jgi:hypothetical protein
LLNKQRRTCCGGTNLYGAANLWWLKQPERGLSDAVWTRKGGPYNWRVQRHWKGMLYPSRERGFSSLCRRQKAGVDGTVKVGGI